MVIDISIYIEQPYNTSKNYIARGIRQMGLNESQRTFAKVKGPAVRKAGLNGYSEFYMPIEVKRSAAFNRGLAGYKYVERDKPKQTEARGQDTGVR